MSPGPAWLSVFIIPAGQGTRLGTNYVLNGDISSDVDDDGGRSMCVGKEVAGSQYGSLRLSPFQPSRTAARLNIQIPREQRYILYFHFSETFLYITNDFQGFGKYPPSKKTHKQNHRFLRQKHRILLSGMRGRSVIEIVN